jgi:hypothetical protein
MKHVASEGVSEKATHFVRKPLRRLKHRWEYIKIDHGEAWRENIDWIELVYLWLYSACWPWSLFQFLNLYTVSRTHWTGDKPVARPLPTYRTIQTQNKRNRHSRLEWDSNPRSQCSLERRHSSCPRSCGHCGRHRTGLGWV